MSKLAYTWWCFVVSAVLGGSWGGVIYLVHEIAGLSIGMSLFCLSFVILVRLCNREEDPVQHNRRFNDI